MTKISKETWIKIRNEANNGSKVNDICKKYGISKAGFYKHFSQKKEKMSFFQWFKALFGIK